MKIPALLLLAAMLFCSPLVKAQERTGSISGNVADAGTKAALKEVVITLYSPALSGPRLAVTDSVGNYKFLGLVGGIYRLTFEMEGYEKAERENIPLTEDVPVMINLDMRKVVGIAGVKINR